MLLDFRNLVHAAEYRVLDCAGRVIRDAISYDTKTHCLTMQISLPDALPACLGGNEADRYLLTLSADGEPIPALVSVILSGSLAVDSAGREIN